MLPTAAEQADVSYADIRDRLLSSSDKGEYAEWLIRVGRYVHDRWLAEERVRVAGQPFDESANAHLWDECSEKYFRDIMVDALSELKAYRRRKFIDSVRDFVLSDARKFPLKWIGWFLKTMLEGFVGGIGLIVLGFIFVWLEPHLVKSIRGALDDALPERTSPYPTTTCPAGATHRTDPVHC